MVIGFRTRREECDSTDIYEKLADVLDPVCRYLLVEWVAAAEGAGHWFEKGKKNFVAAENPCR